MRIRELNEDVKAFKVVKGVKGVKELRMENGEWRMENGEWRMENWSELRFGGGVIYYISIFKF